jgi:cell wall-associated NlpC family hydrolase
VTGRRIAALSCVLAMTLSGMPAAPASASPLGDRRSQAIAVQKDVAALDDKLDTAVEDYNDAALRYSGLREKTADLRSRIHSLDARTAVLQRSLAIRADAMYRTGPTGILDVLLGAATFEDFATTWDILTDLSAREAGWVSELKSARAQAVSAKVELDAAELKAKSEYKVVAGKRKAIEAKLADRKRLLAGLETEIARLLAEQRARELAKHKAWKKKAGAKVYADPKTAPRGSVVEIALRYLGRPYHWAASGPGSFDCSGFTMYVYRQAGVSLPHSSRAQSRMGARVSRSALKPGDLVFFGSPVHHVGIYIGGGQFVHSPHTGDVVSVDELYDDFVWGSRL